MRQIEHALRSTLNILDELRDAQVQLLAIGKMRRSFPTARHFYACLLAREGVAIKGARRDVRGVTGGRLWKLIETARDDAKRRGRECPVARASRMLLAAVDRAFARTVRLKNQIDSRRPETIHRTRVAFKRFRYMYETLARRAPCLDQGLVVEMQHYQTMMGEIQDAELLLVALDNFLHDKKTTAQAAARLRDELLRRRQWVIAMYLDNADQLKAFWK